MAIAPLKLRVLTGDYSVCRLSPDQAVPQWPFRGAFLSITRTSAELSIVSETQAVPPDVKAEGGWRVLAVDGPLDFGLTGIVAGLATALANASVTVFVVSTYDTDYILVRAADLDPSIAALRRAGHDVVLA